MLRKVGIRFVAMIIVAGISSFMFAGIVYVLKAIDVAGIDTFSYTKGVLYFFLVLSSVTILNMVCLLIPNITFYILLTLCTTPMIMLFLPLSGIAFHGLFVVIFGFFISFMHLRTWCKAYLVIAEGMSEKTVNVLLK